MSLYSRVNERKKQTTRTLFWDNYCRKIN